MQISIKAIGVNRADVFYKQGKYPVFGIELAGIGEDGKNYGAIINGGAYAKTATVEHGCFVELPKHYSFTDGAAVTEALYTSYYNLVHLCKLSASENVLIHGGAGSVGVTAIQLAKLLGANVFATAKSPEKLKLIRQLGATPINYTSDFGKNKFDIIIDVAAANNFSKNLDALKHNGRLAMIGFIGGAKTEANLAPILIKNLSVFGSTIQSLPNSVKAQIKDGFAPYLPQIKPVIDKVYKFEEQAQAIEYVEKYSNIGKVVVEV